MQFPSCPSCYGLVAVARFVIFSFLFHRSGTIYHDMVLANISSYFFGTLLHNLVTLVQVWSLIDIICEIHVFQYHFQVRLSSKSPWDPPLVDPCYLCDQSDSELLVKAIQQTVNMVNSSSELKRLLSGIFLLLFKGVFSIKAWLAIAKLKLLSLFITLFWHCKMLP